MKKNKLTFLIVGILAISMLAAGCGNKADQPAQGGQSEQPQQSASEPQDGGTLTIGLSQVPKNLDPVKYTGTYESNVMRSVFDTVVAWSDDQTEILPCLAESWVISDDMMEYTFTLRDDVYFHNGRQMTAEDVKYSLERSEKESAMQRLADLDHAEVIDDTTVKLVLKAPNAAFLARLTDAGNGIVPQEEIEALGDKFGQQPVGTGAFKFESWENNIITLAKNDQYFLETPHLDKVEFKFINDLTQMGNALTANDISVAHEIADVDLQKFKADDTVQVLTSPGMNVYMLEMNVVSGPTANAKVREAITYAIDVDAAVKNIFPNGGATRAYVPLPENSWGFKPEYKDYAVTRDVEKSKALLKEAGYEEGFDITLYAPNKPNRAKWSEILQSQLAEVGINVTIEKLEWGTYSAAVAANQAPMFLQGWTWYPDPEFFLTSFFHSNNVGTLGNGIGYDDPEVTQWLNDAKGSTSEQSERADIYQKVIDKVMGEYVCVPGWTTENVSVVNGKVHGYKVFSDAGVRLVTPSGTNVWIEQ